MSSLQLWLSPQAKEKIKELKKLILKKKIMLSFIIDNYSWWDKAYRYTHYTVATVTPLLAVIQTTLNDNNALSNTAMIVLSCIVAVMVKLKDYMTYGEIRDLAKSQTIKYSQLYERIDREMIKSDDKKQSIDDFLYWINREFNNIEMLDPELSYSEKQKFILLCKEKGIAYDDDLNALELLIAVKPPDIKEPIVPKDNPVTNATLTTIVQPVTNNTDIVPVNTVAQPIIDTLPPTNIKNEDEKKIDCNSTDIHDVTINNDAAMCSDTSNTHPNEPNLPTLHRVLSLSNSHPSHDAELYVSPRLDRSPTDEEIRKRYKSTLKSMNSKEDMRWAMDRLNSLG